MKVIITVRSRQWALKWKSWQGSYYAIVFFEFRPFEKSIYNLLDSCEVLDGDRWSRWSLKTLWRRNIYEQFLMVFVDGFLFFSLTFFITFFHPLTLKKNLSINFKKIQFRYLLFILLLHSIWFLFFERFHVFI